MANQGGLQLIPENRKKFVINSSGNNKTLWIGTIVLVLILLLTFSLKWYSGSKESKINDLDIQLSDLEKRRDKDNEKNILTFSKQSAQISSVLSNHIFWTKGLTKIENLIQPQVQVLNISGDALQDKFEFKAQAANYTVLARQIAAFNNDPAFQDVVVNEIDTLENGRAEFSIKLTFKKVEFLQDNE